VNAFRAAQGMPALAAHPALMAAAQRQADWIAANHRGSHTGEGGTMPQDRAAAAGYTGFVLENVAGGTLGYATVTWAVEGWASSPGHRWTMLNEAADGGAGVAADAENEYYVFLIGRPASPFPPYPGAESGPTPASAPAAENPPSPASVVVPVALAEPDENGNVYHVVQTGQTAWDIAARYGVALDDLLALNGWQRSTVLKPGDRVLVRPGSGQAAPLTPTPIQEVVVKEGQTLWEIAVTHGLTVDELLAYNHLTRADILHPGDLLRLVPENAVPTLAPTPTITLTPPPTATTTPALTLTATSTPTQAPTATLAATPVPTETAAPSSPTPSPTPPAPIRADHSDADIDRSVITGVIGIVILALVLIGIGMAWWINAARHDS
jgi:LysM repeat protein